MAGEGAAPPPVVGDPAPPEEEAGLNGRSEEEESTRVDEPTKELPVGTVEGILEVAPKDLIEEWVDVPEWECRVKIKTFTADQRAQIRQIGIRSPETAWGDMEVHQFLMAVVEPKFNEHQARKLHQNSGAGFARVIERHDELSAMSKEELREAREAFRGPDE